MPLYRVVRLFLLPFFLIYFRLDRIGREHVPTDGPIIFASNHRSFLDPFIIGDDDQAAALLRGQDGALQQAAAGLVPQLARRDPGRPRAVRRRSC